MRRRLQNFRADSPIYQTLRRLRKPAPTVLTRRIDGTNFLFLEKYCEASQRTIDEVQNHENFVHLKRTVAEMKRLCSDSGTQLHVFLIPTKGRVYPWILNPEKPRQPDARVSGFSDAMMLLCQELKIEFQDVNAYLSDRAIDLYETEHKFLWWPDDTHWNALGQFEAARFIASRIHSLQDE